MTFGKLSIISFVFFISLVILTIILYKKDEIDGKDTKEKCDAVLNPLSGLSIKDGQQCGIWSKNMCLKGKFSLKDGTCSSNGDIKPLVSLILAGVSLISSIVFLVLWYRNKA
jgi:hypothetical protein